MVNNTIFVNVPIERHEELIQKELQLNTVAHALFDSAELNYSKDGLRVDGDVVTAVLRLLWPEETKRVIAALRRADPEV